MFEAELSAWMEAETTWPQPRTREMFDEWFDVELVDAVVDLVPDEPLTEAEVEGADIDYALHHCAWCDIELEAEDLRAVGLALPDRELLAVREGLTIVIPASARLLIGIMSTPDSPAAMEGHDVMFSACSSRCEKILRKDAARGLKRLRTLTRTP